MSQFTYPLSIQFKLLALANEFHIKDFNENEILYVKQKAFKFKENIKVFKSESGNELLYEINANKWLDFSASYVFQNTSTQQQIGMVARKGWRSMWKAKYEIFDENNQLEFTLQEENAWTKVFDSMLGEIPVLGMLTGYMFNPSYIIKRADTNVEVIRLKKEPSFFGRKFTITQLGTFDNDEEIRLNLGLMMALVLERNRG